MKTSLALVLAASVLACGPSGSSGSAAADGGTGAPDSSTPTTDGGQDSGLAPALLTLAPASYDFESWGIGALSPAQVFTATNTGTGASGALTVTLTPGSGTTVGEFPLTDGCTGKTLGPSATCTVSVQLDPATVGSKSAALVVNATPGGSATASLTGTGLAPSALAIAPTSYAFPTTTVGASPLPTQSFTVTNTGGATSAALTTGLTYRTGTTSGEFAITADQCAGKTLAAGASCVVTVEFAPASSGAKSASLNIDGGALAATLTGTGQETFTLTVQENGTGGGTVTDATSAIRCGSICSAPFSSTTGEPVATLTATPNATSRFAGWAGGGCSGSTSTTCAVTLSAATTVTATFNEQESLTVSFRAIGSGQGSAAMTSTPAGISCTGPVNVCTARFDMGQAVTLNVTGLGAGALASWKEGSCTTETSTSCSLTMSGAQTAGYVATTDNIVFTSSATANGGGGVAAGDAVCVAAATSGGLPGKYVALLNTSTTNAFARLGSARGWIRLDGLPFGDTIASLQSYVTFYPSTLDETGAMAPDWNVWTGLPYPPNSGFVNCSDWSSTSASVYGWGGLAQAGANEWASDFNSTCNLLAAFYCFETDFTSPVSVPAATGRHVFVSSNSLLLTSVGQADTECQSEAQAAGLANPTHFLALLGTTTASAESRFNLNGANWIRPDDVVLATSPAAFMADEYAAPISVLASGAVMPDGFLFAWTGGLPNAVPASTSSTCDDWTSNASTLDGEVGNPGMPYMASMAKACNTPQLLVCVEN